VKPNVHYRVHKSPTLVPIPTQMNPVHILSPCFPKVKVKVKLSLCFFFTDPHAMKAYWRSGCVAPRILDLGTIWRWVVSFTPRQPYPQGKSPRYPLNRRLGGPQSRSVRGDEEKEFAALCRDSNPPIIQPVAQRYKIQSLPFRSYNCWHHYN